MTIPRPPLSLDAAIARIMGQLGSWAEVARVTGYAHPRQCEKWGAFDIAEPGDNDARDIPMRAAVKLDIAYQAAGGIGRPIFEAYGLLVDVAESAAFGDRQELQRDTIAFMKENSEAETALLEASMPGAGAAEEAIAQRELLQVVQWGQRILARLAGRQRAPP
ncbi:MAG: hypothetical protein DI606_04280 [Sphingobium sp.]|uniref:hypothetical protein n=1 Tax=Sphingobium sp. TaxID=1912891 RepID=UPI000DB8EC66|nr:hypothetical protein [Sphingobium sp.]PZU13791.1 MAG: hypothetical protein DI606_04280 [Sphingobium sp.]